MAKILSNFMKTYKFKKHELNIKKTMLSSITNKLMTTRDKEKNLKSGERKKRYNTHRETK